MQNSPSPPRPSKIHFRLPASTPSGTSSSSATEKTCYYTLQIYKCAHPLTPRSPPTMYHAQTCPFPLPAIQSPSNTAPRSGRLIFGTLDTSPRIQMLNEYCHTCKDGTRKDTDVDGEWVLVFQGEGEQRVEKWITVRIEGGCDWRGIGERGEADAVIRDRMGEEWVLFG